MGLAFRGDAPRDRIGCPRRARSERTARGGRADLAQGQRPAGPSLQPCAQVAAAEWLARHLRGEGGPVSGVRVPPRAHMRPHPRRIRARARPRSERVRLGASAEAVWEPWEESEASTVLSQGQG